MNGGALTVGQIPVIRIEEQAPPRDWRPVWVAAVAGYVLNPERPILGAALGAVAAYFLFPVARRTA